MSEDAKSEGGRPKQRRRALLGLGAFFTLILAVLLLGRSMLELDEGSFNRFFEAFRGSPWAPFIVLATFVGGAFLGLPQWALYAGTIVAFGPIWGALMAWGSTLVSGSVNFWLGRLIGAERVSQYGGELVNRLTALLKRNGFIASFAVRLVPTGPFILVNMVAGVAGMRFLHFLGGMAAGIIPKLAVVGLVVQGAVSGMDDPRITVAFALLALVAVAIMWGLRKRLTGWVKRPE